MPGLFALGLVQVALTNLLLSGDNVLIIAVMTRQVRQGQRWVALGWSMLISLALQLGILFALAMLFHVTAVHVVFGVTICLVAGHLVRAGRPRAAAAGAGLHATVVRVSLGNLLMSFENEAALITLAHGSAWLAWAGVAVTSPVVFFGSHWVAAVLRRFPVIVYAGAVYLFRIGVHLVASMPWWGPTAAGAGWALTGAFAVYAAAAYLRQHAGTRAGAVG
jgi:predicted tellurium resistance membrane protein TerC